MMQEYATITHRIDLVLKLIDTVSGVPLTDNNIKIMVNDKLAIPIMKRDGTIIFVNTGRVNCTITVSAKGFLTETIPIVYAELDETPPFLQVSMIPSKLYGVPLLEEEGTTDGITSITAVNKGQPLVLFSEFNERQKTLTVFNPHTLPLDNIYYGIINKETNSFEIIEIVKQISDTKFKLKTALKTKAATQSPICRVIFGKVEGSHYQIGVSNISKSPQFIVCKEINGASEFSSMEQA